MWADKLINTVTMVCEHETGLNKNNLLKKTIVKPNRTYLLKIIHS